MHLPPAAAAWHFPWSPLQLSPSRSTVPPFRHRGRTKKQRDKFRLKNFKMESKFNLGIDLVVGDNVQHLVWILSRSARMKLDMWLHQSASTELPNFIVFKHIQTVSQWPKNLNPTVKKKVKTGFRFVFLFVDHGSGADLGTGPNRWGLQPQDEWMMRCSQVNVIHHDPKKIKIIKYTEIRNDQRIWMDMRWPDDMSWLSWELLDFCSSWTRNSDDLRTRVVTKWIVTHVTRLDVNGCFPRRGSRVRCSPRPVTHDVHGCETVKAVVHGCETGKAVWNFDSKTSTQRPAPGCSQHRRPSRHRWTLQFVTHSAQCSLNALDFQISSNMVSNMCRL